MTRAGITKSTVAGLANLALIVGVGLAPTAAAPTSSSTATTKPIVTVTPSTKLVDHELVKVVGGGVAANTFVSIVQCAPGTPSSQTCDFSTQAESLSGSAGGFYLFWPVHRLLVLGGLGSNNVVDCAKVHCQVVAGAAQVGTGVPAVAPVSFDPSVPPVQQKLFVFPHDNLVDKQLVTVYGNAFTPGASITTVECRAGATSPSQCDAALLSSATADFVGSFQTKFAVRRTILLSTGPLDCASAPGACTLTAVDESRYTVEHATAPLSFNPKAPPPTVTVRVTPSTGLRDDEAVIVHGTGVTPLGSVQLSECSPATDTRGITPFCTNTTSANADQHGDVSATYFVHAVISGPHGLVSCRSKPGTCSIGVNEGFNTTPEAEAPLSFG